MRASCRAGLTGLGLLATVVMAQTIPLPAKLGGDWVAVIPGGQVFRDSLTLVLDPREGYGPVTGKLTIRGVTCGAQDEPLAGTWDGTELRFESMVRPNVNTQRVGRDCGSGKITFVLVRKPSGAFEGESRRPEMSTPVQVTLAP